MRCGLIRRMGVERVTSEGRSEGGRGQELSRYPGEKHGHIYGRRERRKAFILLRQDFDTMPLQPMLPTRLGRCAF